jgi:hypothetical protein
VSFAVSIHALAAAVAAVIGLFAAVLAIRDRGWRRVSAVVVVLAFAAAVVLLVDPFSTKKKVVVNPPTTPTTPTVPTTSTPRGGGSTAPVQTCDTTPFAPKPGKSAGERNDRLTDAGYGLADGSVGAPQLDTANDEDWYALCSSPQGGLAQVTVINNGDLNDTSCTLDIQFLTDKGDENDPAGDSATADVGGGKGTVKAQLDPNRLYYIKVSQYDSGCPDEYAPYPYEIAASPPSAFAK